MPFPTPHPRLHLVRCGTFFALFIVVSSFIFTRMSADARQAIPAATASIQFHTIGTGPIDTNIAYQDLRWQVISVVERAQPDPYLDGKCIPTIGIGFNLRINKILGIVLDTLAPGWTQTQFNALSKMFKENYVLTVDNKGNPTSCNETTFKANLQNAPLTLHFANVNPQMRATFDVVVKDYEKQVTGWFAQIPPSLERIAFVSLAYNGILSKSPTLRADLIKGNRALAWYEIRYNSNAGNDALGSHADQVNAKGLATRRDFESDLFGLYDGNPSLVCTTCVSNTNATQVMSMVAIHETQLYTSVAPDASGLYNNRYYVNPDDLTGQANSNYATAIAAVQTAITGNFGVQNLAYDLGPAVSYLLYNPVATSSGNTLVMKNSTAVDLNTLGAFPYAVFVQSTAAGVNVTMNSQSGLVYSNTNDTITMGAGLEELTFGSGQHTINTTSLNATMSQNLPLDTITFDGQSIAGTVLSGSKDAFGRTYVLNCASLTITNAADSLTIKGFQSGNSGLTVQSGNSGLTVQGRPICFYVTSITKVSGGASQVILSVPDINNITCANVLQVWTATGTLMSAVNWNNGPLYGWYWPSYYADMNGQYYLRTYCDSTAEPYLNTGNNPVIYSQVFTVINGNYP